MFWKEGRKTVPAHFEYDHGPNNYIVLTVVGAQNVLLNYLR